MTLQELKENRNEIITKINEVIEDSDVSLKDMMTKVAEYATMNQAIEMEDMSDIINDTFEELNQADSKVFHRITEIEEARSRDLMKHI